MAHISSEYQSDQTSEQCVLQSGIMSDRQQKQNGRLCVNLNPRAFPKLKVLRWSLVYNGAWMATSFAGSLLSRRAWERGCMDGWIDDRLPVCQRPPASSDLLLVGCSSSKVPNLNTNAFLHILKTVGCLLTSLKFLLSCALLSPVPNPTW